jgi:hypothetical protein
MNAVGGGSGGGPPGCPGLGSGATFPGTATPGSPGRVLCSSGVARETAAGSKTGVVGRPLGAPPCPGSAARSFTDRGGFANSGMAAAAGVGREKRSFGGGGGYRRKVRRARSGGLCIGVRALLAGLRGELRVSAKATQLLATALLVASCS